MLVNLVGMVSFMSLDDYYSGRVTTATLIALEVGAIKSCQYHEGYNVNQCSSEANNAAYRLAAFRYKKGEYSEFSSQQDLTDEIKAAIDLSLDSCIGCDKYLKD